MTKVRIGIVGLGFGAEFIPIYQAHPDAELVAICQRSESSLNQVGAQFGIDRRYSDYEELLADPDVDAVHINTPIGLHAEQTISALNAGKHVACTVPMATSIEDCYRIVDATKSSGKNYMMMETAVYTREFLYAKELLKTGDAGRIQFLRGSHIQEMAGWPEYWRDLPPMHYATHAISPLLALASTEAASVRCVGSGHVNHQTGPSNPFAVESALFSLRDSDLAMEVTRSLFDVAREYIESFSVYATGRSFEWQQLEREAPVEFQGEDGTRIEVPDYADRLPVEIRPFTRHGVYGAENQHLSFLQGSGHGGSHPHLVHEFVSSILEKRAPFPSAPTAANWTSAGLVAHESALAGRELPIPNFATDNPRKDSHGE